MRKSKRPISVYMKDPQLAIYEAAVLASGLTESAWMRNALVKALWKQGFDVDEIESRPDRLIEIVEGLRASLDANSKNDEKEIPTD